MLKKIIQFLIITLVILLPLVNSHFFDLIGINWGFYVNGNYEFSKVIFFNILSGIIIFLFFINLFFHKKKLIIPLKIHLLLGLLILSTIFSSYFYTSLFGTAGKGHGILMFINLIGLFIVFINLEKKYLKTILHYSIIGSLLVIGISLKEYYLPTFDYGNLNNRALGTFGHPNYLALYLLIFIPFLIKGINKTIYKIILLSVLILVILTKSIWGIFIAIIYILYILYRKKKRYISIKIIYILGILSFIILLILIYKFGLITKLNSFISRFYIWETTLNIILIDIKNIFLGLGADSLSYTFDSYKVAELYIYENIGYTADRPHNLLLNIFYHFGILGLSFFIYMLYCLFKNHKKTIFTHSIVLFLIFTLFNFSSISNYLIIILVGAIIYIEKPTSKKYKHTHTLPYLFLSLIGVYGSLIYYNAEYKKYLNEGNYSQNIYYNTLILENPENKAIKNTNSIVDACLFLTKDIPSVENYFYCGDILWDSNKEVATIYYKKGLNLLPDMWNQNSKYYDNIIVKQLYVPERFYSEKFSTLKEILDKMNMKF